MRGEVEGLERSVAERDVQVAKLARDAEGSLAHQDREREAQALRLESEREGERAARETEGGVREGEHAAAVEVLRGEVLEAQEEAVRLREEVERMNAELGEAREAAERLRGEVLPLNWILEPHTPNS